MTVRTDAIAPSAASDGPRVRALEDLGVLDAGPEERFDRITRLAQRMFDVSTVAVTLIDQDRQYVKSSGGRPIVDLRRQDAFCDRTIQERRTLVVEDAAADVRFAANPLVTGSPHLRFYAGHPLEAPGGHRIGALCLLDDSPRRFSEPERALLEELAQWVQAELTRSAELEHAAQVQRSFAPRRGASVPGYQVAGVCLPSRGVGGDFVDWYGTTGGGLALSLVDVMGKGMAAALMMATVRATMRSAGRDHGPAAAVIDAAATLFEDLSETGTLVTAWHAVLDPLRHELRFADAGHGLVLMVRADGGVERLTGTGLPIGVLPDERWDEGSVTLDEDDLVVAFSDGLLDLYDGTMVALDRIADELRGAPTAQAAVDRLAAVARRTTPREDDVTVVAVRRAG